MQPVIDHCKAQSTTITCIEYHSWNHTSGLTHADDTRSTNLHQKLARMSVNLVQVFFWYKFLAHNWEQKLSDTLRELCIGPCDFRVPYTHQQLHCCSNHSLRPDFEVTGLDNSLTSYKHTLVTVSFCNTTRLVTQSCSTKRPSSSIWPRLSYGLVRSKREYYHNYSLVVVLCGFCSCTLIWAAYRFCLPDLASSHWVHSLCLGYLVCVRLFSCVTSACML